MSQQLRSRRSNLAVPGSSPKMLEKAKGLAADQVFMDIEDAVAPIAKPDARKNIVAALNHEVPPLLLDVLLEGNTQGAVVPGRTGSTIDLTGLENEAAVLSEGNY